MSNVAQMEDNLSYMRAFRPLNVAEQAVISQAQRALKEIPQIACTACHYCCKGCPMQIPIPEIFAAMNTKLVWGQDGRARREYSEATENAGKASDCIQCGQCESACPQQLKIITLLKDAAAALE